jgi:peptide/nickel transport system ATP-binding protein
VIDRAGHAGSPEGGPLLEVRELRTWFRTDIGEVPAVDGVSFDVGRGETLALLGESGCGKSVTALSILRLLDYPPAWHPGGQILFEGGDVLTMPAGKLRRLRGGRISMIFQEPMTSLNPVYTVGEQIVEAIVEHQEVSRAEAVERAVEALRAVQIPAPETRLESHPHEMSGGMQQRAMIAMALACDPELLIADEPTTALDVTVQAEILDLLSRLQSERRLAMLFITHDFGVAARVATRIAVMYAGKIVEMATTADLFAVALHPYALGLFRSLPRMGRRLKRLYQIPGSVPSPLAFPPGCRFHPRCAYAVERCREQAPPLIEHRPDHWAACWRTSAAGLPPIEESV